PLAYVFMYMHDCAVNFALRNIWNFGLYEYFLYGSILIYTVLFSEPTGFA
ncbi:hypothetical protein ACJX0J_010345, partial [Zea mays]